MQEKCNGCVRPSKGCIPFLMSLSTPELREWFRVWTDRLGWSHAQLAEKSTVPKGTVDRILGRGDVGISLTTIRLLICAFTGCSLAELAACSANSGNFEAAEEIRQLKDENQRLKQELAYSEKLGRKDEATIGRMERLLVTRNRYIVALLVTCITMMFAMLYSLGLDVSSPDIDFVRDAFTAPLTFIFFAVIICGVAVAVASVVNLMKNKKT